MNDSFLRGVNLGGWLILEKWMTPSVFAGTAAIDEWTFMATPGAAERIERHHATFITEADFRWLAEHGVNAVRIPVGYWVLEGDERYVSGVRWLDWAMDMADKYELQVLIDVHGLPGSQNGRDHSGQVGKARWYREAAYRERSVAAVAVIARRYRDRASLWGVQIINEPRTSWAYWTLRRYYRRVYRELVRILRPETAIVISDAFMPRRLSGALRATSHPVILDIHLYHMATPFAKSRSIEWFFAKTRRRGKLLKRLGKTQPIIIGEWSGVISGETMRQIPRERHDELFEQYVALQQEVYSATHGWFYWSYKTEGPDQWNFRAQAGAGRIGLDG